eukprot:7979820-Pyramimonas_sp.AAC.1
MGRKRAKTKTTTTSDAPSSLHPLDVPPCRGGRGPPKAVLPTFARAHSLRMKRRRKYRQSRG